ncbi:HAD family hydrolase [Shewanella waksmanii]|uniref:HAD family hydrolase n=1 Tax=Shewanella waksmanii TaxID=213783 RepID=UPI0037358011
MNVNMPKNTPAIAFFDFDGTITFADSFTQFMRYSAQPWRLLYFGPLLLPLYLGYKAGIIPPSPLRRLVSFVALRGRSHAQLAALGYRYTHDKINHFVRPQMLQRIRWHQAQNHHVVVVSASLDLYLLPWCQQYGLDLICSEVEHHQGKLSGFYVKGDCCKQAKSERILNTYSLEHYHRVYAYGDTEEDFAMLALADEAYLNNQPYSPAS